MVCSDWSQIASFRNPEQHTPKTQANKTFKPGFQGDDCGHRNRKETWIWRRAGRASFLHPSAREVVISVWELRSSTSPSASGDFQVRSVTSGLWPSPQAGVCVCACVRVSVSMPPRACSQELVSSPSPAVCSSRARVVGVSICAFVFD